ncbi:MAG TPA: peptidase domain-containing ABC transporter [Polyangiales bacterium]|nr:peptidase domain-containing ABC transporter [Polyangiales bacterium]
MIQTQSLSALSERFPALKRLASVGSSKVPFVPQHSAVECGVACLAMVLAYHGKHVAREDLRSALGPTRDGVRAAHLLRTGRHFGLRGRGFKAELDALRQVPRGAVLHWQFNHYVVLQAVGKEHIDIVDPARGPRRVPWHELDKAFTGVVLIFEPGADFVASDNRPKRKGLYANILRAGDWKRIFSISFASQLVSLALPMLVALIVDRVLPRSDAQLLYVVAIGLALIAAFYGVSQIVRGHLLLHLRTLLDAKMSMELVDRMLALPYTFFQQRSVGDLILRLESSKMVREVLTSGALTAVLDGTMMLLYLGLLLAISPLLGVVVISLGAVNVLVLVTSRGRRRAFHAEMIDRQAASESYQYEMLSAMETIKGMGCEQRAIDRWCNLFVDMLNNQLSYGRIEIMFQALTSTLRLGAPLVIFTLGALQVLDGKLSMGTMLAVNTFAVGVFDPLSRLVEKLEQFERLHIYVDRMLDIYESPREQELGKPPVHEALDGAIEFQDVSFRHGPLEQDVIRETSLQIRSGEFIGIVGPSGAGKSTLASLMLGLYQPTVGRVLYDGRPLQEVDLETLRAQIGVVTQDTQLFAGTIRSNIAMADPDLPQVEVERAAKLAQIHDDIARMPAGYNTVLSTGGSSISGGQRQRIALARALARRPAVLLLDEATSALDSLSEAGIQAALERIRCTRIVIAHRLSTIARADRILVVEGGRIVEQGSPRELLAKGAAFARLVAQQTGQPLLSPAAMGLPAPQQPESDPEVLASQLRRATVVVANTNPAPTRAPAVDVAPDLVITQPGLPEPKPARRISTPAISAVRMRKPDAPVVTVVACQIIGVQPEDRAS